MWSSVTGNNHGYFRCQNNQLEEVNGKDEEILVLSFFRPDANITVKKSWEMNFSTFPIKSANSSARAGNHRILSSAISGEKLQGNRPSRRKKSLSGTSSPAPNGTRPLRLPPIFGLVDPPVTRNITGQYRRHCSFAPFRYCRCHLPGRNRK